MNSHQSQECRKIAPLIETVANGRGESNEIAAVESHLLTCGDCRTEYHQWKQAVLLTEAWRLADVPESRRDWNDLHARLTAAPPRKLRPAFSSRLGWGGLVGATAVAALCLLLPQLPKERERGRGGEGEYFVAVQAAPKAKMPAINESAVLGTKTYPAEKGAFYGRTFAASSLINRKKKKETPTLTFAKTQEHKFYAPQKKSVSPRRGVVGGLLAQTKPPASRRVLLNVDGETSTLNQSREYALGAVPSGQGSDIQLMPASYSSAPSEKIAW